MKTMTHLRRKIRSYRCGFSLVEVTLALGIVAFALLSITGLMSTGLKNFASATDRSTMSRITATLAHDVLNGDFDAALSNVRYFSVEGVEVPSAQVGNSVYQAQLLTVPDASNPHTKTVLVQVAHNPGGGVALLQEDIGGGLQVWSKTKNQLAVSVQPILVSRRTPVVVQ